MKLEKATLINIEQMSVLDSSAHIKFMFNPNQISFSRSISIEQSSGARNNQGDNKTSFKHPNPYTVQIAGIPLDTYETGTSVLEEINTFKKSVEFVGASGNPGSQGENRRPPIYLFTWGSNRYLRCFVKTFNFKLTLFLPDGTPVRATVDLTLEQVDIPNPQPSQSASNPSSKQRQQSGRSLPSDTYL
jgi:Contractile injection system tube protein